MPTLHNFIVYNPDGTEAYNGTFSDAPIIFNFLENSIVAYKGSGTDFNTISINVDNVTRYKVIGVDGSETYYNVGESATFSNDVEASVYIYADQTIDIGGVDTDEEESNSGSTVPEASIEISITSPNGTKLLTKGKICDKDITVRPALQEKTVTANGDVTPDKGYVGLRKVTVNIENAGDGTTPTYQEKTVAENGEVTPDEGYDALSKVTVSIPVYAGETQSRS